MKPIGIILGLLLGLSACDREEIGPQSNRPGGEGDTAATGLVYVLNEGNFGRGNAGISIYDPLAKSTQNQAFRDANGGLPLGDVAQAMGAHDGKWYLALNGSSALVRLDSVSLEEEARLSGVGTPAGMALMAGKAYLTDVYQSKLRRVDLTRMEVDTTVSLPGPGKGVQAGESYLAVATSYGVVVYEQGTLQRDTLLSTSGPVNSLAIPKENGLWALMDGTQADSLLGWQLTNWQPKNGHALGKNSSLLRSTVRGDSLFWLQEKEVWHLPTGVGKPAAAFSSPLQTPYGLNLDPYRGELYLCDALDFNQASLIYRMSRSGSLIDSFRTGPISNQLRFAHP